MKHVVRVTEKRERHIVIEADRSYNEILDKIVSEVTNDNQFFNYEKVNREVYYANATRHYMDWYPEEYNKLTPDYTFLEEDTNTVRARQYAQSICEIFEDILAKHDITIPDPDRNSQGEGEEAARIYGETYFNLEDDITNMITDIVNRVKRDEIKVISDTY